MKKIFTLIGVALIALSANAQDEIYNAVGSDGTIATEFLPENMQTVADPAQTIATVNREYVTLVAVNGATPKDIKKTTGGKEQYQAITVAPGTQPSKTVMDGGKDVSVYPCTVDEWKAPTWESKSHGDTGFRWLVGTGVPYTTIYGIDLGFQKDNGEEAYKPYYDYYQPDGSAGLPKTGEYVKVTAKEDGMMKFKAWVNKGGRRLFIVDPANDMKALTWDSDKSKTEFRVEGYINGQKNEDNTMKFFDYMTVEDYELQPDVNRNGAVRLVWFVFNVKAGKEYWIFGDSWQFGFAGYEYYKGKDIAHYEPAVAFTVPDETDLAEAVNKKFEENPNATDFIANLVADGMYTMSTTITTGRNLTINGAKNATTGEVPIVYAPEDGTPFITLDGATEFAKKADGTASDSYYSVGEINLTNFEIVNGTNAIIKDNQKILLGKLAIDNVRAQVDGTNNVIDFNGKGYIADFALMNSTIYSMTGHTGYFYQAGGRVRDLDDSQSTYKQKVTVDHCTLAMIAQGQQANNFKGAGQKSLEMTLTHSILVDFGSKATAIVRGWLGGQASANPKSVYANNTYLKTYQDVEDVIETEWTTGTGSDQTSTSYTTVPGFDPDEVETMGFFTISNLSVQSNFNEGDPYWNPGFAGIYNNVIANDNGTVTVDKPVCVNVHTEGEAETVTVTIVPNEGCTVEGVTATWKYSDANGSYSGEQTVTKVDATTYTFKAFSPEGLNSFTIDVKANISGGGAGISSIAAKSAIKDGKMYNLNGQRVDKAQKGLYIMNGKKYVVK